MDLYNIGAQLEGRKHRIFFSGCYLCTCITFDGDFSNINQNKIPDRVLWPQFLNFKKKTKNMKKS